ncbi:MAG: hypothetical protein H7251_02855 [Acetobacteraceae bacterium]|nr:hypothetical protein [Acetobacteraceae bacterium]
MDRPIFLRVALCLLLSGCMAEPTGALVGANVASVIVFGRGIGDILISAGSGQDCSIVRLDQGKSYCRPVEPAPEPPPYCTKSLGGIDCWLNPEALLNPPRQVADGPRALTAEQEARRTRVWPF